MPVFDPAVIAGVLADLSVSLLSYAGIAAILYNLGGVLIRTVSWTFDKLIINFIGFFYKYFETIIDGTLLSDSIVKGMMDRVYLLVGVFVVFRLGMLLFNYAINPAEVMDEKLGVNALVKRVIIGLVLILFMPNIFSFVFRVQKAILDDQVIERIIMPESDMKKVKENKEKHGMGKIIGMTVFRGFFNLSSTGQASNKVVQNFEKAMDVNRDYDLSVIDNLSSGSVLNNGILTDINGEYVHDYFPIFSTVVLGYVLYLVVQYCLDAVVRSFKLSILQVIAPIAVVEYMINGDRNDVFKSWKKAVISTFAMLIMRVVSIWFVAYVTMLMQKGNSDPTSLLQTGDNLLKAIIVLGLLAFMMDFPKMMSDIFGLDLDQSGAVKNVMGKAMGAATTGLALGGAAAGFGMKAAGATSKTIRGGMTAIAGEKSSFAKGLNNPVKSALKQGGALAASSVAGLGALTKSAKDGSSIKDNYKMNKTMMNAKADKLKNSKFGTNVGIGLEAMKEGAGKANLGTTLKTGAIAAGAAILASNSVTKSAAGGYQQTAGAISGAVGKEKQKEQQEMSDRMQADMQANMANVSNQVNKMVANTKFDATVQLAARIASVDSSIVDSTQLATAVVNAQINANHDVGQMSSTMKAGMETVQGATREIATTQDAQMVISTQLREQGISESTIQQINSDIEVAYSGANNGGTPQRIYATDADAQKWVTKALEYEYRPDAEKAAKMVPLSNDNGQNP